MKLNKIFKLFLIIFASLIALGLIYYSLFMLAINNTEMYDNMVVDLDLSNLSSESKLNDPYLHSIYLARSSDGINWQKDEEILFDHASMPGAVVRDGKIYLYFVDASGEQDQLFSVVSDDEGKTFNQKKRVTISGVLGHDVKDPHPELIDGKIVLYYFDGSYSNGGSSENSVIYQASSSDGINFENQEEIYRFSSLATDLDIFKVDDNYHMLVNQAGELKLLKSSDGKNFVMVEGFNWRKGSASDTHSFNGEYRTYYCEDNSINIAVGANKNKLIDRYKSVLMAGSGELVCNLSIVELGDEYLMFYIVGTNNDHNI